MPHFCRLTCGPIGRILRKALSTWSTNDYDIHSHWIYIQWPACTFNLSSSSSSVAGTGWSNLRRLAALLSTHRCEVLPHRRPGYPSTHPHLLLFSGDGSRTGKPSYSPPRGQPLPSLPRLRVVPFLVLSACRGQHGQRTTSIESGLYVERLTAGSTVAHKEMSPYYAQNTDSST